MAKSLIRLDWLVNMSASADVLAQAKVEVDLSQIPLGKNVRELLAQGRISQKLTEPTRLL